MSRILQLEVPDATYAVLEQQAVAEGVQPESVAMRTIEEQFPVTRLKQENSQTAAQNEAARAFRAMFGAESL